ncbi:MAG: hypothetical protein AB7D17_07690, partial [Methanobacteriales archaeon]
NFGVNINRPVASVSKFVPWARIGNYLIALTCPYMMEKAPESMGGPGPMCENMGLFDFSPENVNWSFYRVSHNYWSMLIICSYILLYGL